MPATLETPDAPILDLLPEVEVKAEGVLMASGSWPADELESLLEYMRHEVLPRVAIEARSRLASSKSEQSAPGEQSTKVEQPSASDQCVRYSARLSSGISALELAASGEGSRSIEQLRATVRALLAQLRRHLDAEHQATRGLPSRNSSNVT